MKNTHGGPGRGGGRKPAKEPRNIKKMIRWTMAEWVIVVEEAIKAGETVSEYQRRKVLAEETN